MRRQCEAKRIGSAVAGAGAGSGRAGPDAARSANHLRHGLRRLRPRRERGRRQNSRRDRSKSPTHSRVGGDYPGAYQSRAAVADSEGHSRAGVQPSPGTDQRHGRVAPEGWQLGFQGWRQLGGTAGNRASAARLGRAGGKTSSTARRDAARGRYDSGFFRCTSACSMSPQISPEEQAGCRCCRQCARVRCSSSR